MKNLSNPTRQNPGFALVVTLSLMVLLTLVAVGLLGLSAVSLRSATSASAQAEARANARLALMLAIGELQREMGPDQRVSASSDIVASSTVNHSHWTGVWESWKAGSTTSGSDATSEHSTINGATNSGMAPSYQAQRKDHFRSWLVSLTPSERTTATSPASLSLTGAPLPTKASDAVQLVGSGTIGNDSGSPYTSKDYVSARLLPVKSSSPGNGTSGRYAWWVGDESQKARIMSDSFPSSTSLTSAEKIFRQESAGSTGTTTIRGLEKIADDTQFSKTPSLRSVDLVKGATGKPGDNFLSTTPFSYSVLADVREGGLKRDLSTLLERPINSSESGDEFMLYRFDSQGQERVPIQDLAAYYQLYDGNKTSESGINHSSWKQGARYSSSIISNGLQVVAPNFGGSSTSDATYYNEYTTLYRQPIPIKVQFLLTMTAEPIPSPNPSPPNTHYLRLGVTPSITLWNPSNLPMVMQWEKGQEKQLAQMMRMGNIPLQISWSKNGGPATSKKNLFWYVSGADHFKDHLFNMYFSGVRPIKFAPGEVKVFSFPYKGDVSSLKNSYSGNWNAYKKFFFFKTDDYYEPCEVSPGWDPSGMMLYQYSAAGGAPDVPSGTNKLAFQASDNIQFQITTDNVIDSALGFYFNQTNHQSYSGGGTWMLMNYDVRTRYGSTNASQLTFNTELIRKGIPGNATVINSSNRSGSSIIANSGTPEGYPFLEFSLMAATETSEAANGGSFGGRKFASRPFLHSTAITPSVIDNYDGKSLYNYGWNWWVQPINSIFEANVQVTGGGNGYYGGGYTPENGTTSVVQQEIPVVPPMSIAALSSAHLGGYSIAPYSSSDVSGAVGIGDAMTLKAVGYGGVFPHTLQAIGNSYANPNIPADKAFINWSRPYLSSGSAKTVTYADNSYLANKALWDDYFFSSITPQPSTVKLFEKSSRSAKLVANEFFFNSNPLPNRRITPYSIGFDQTKFDALFATSSQQLYTNGLADKISARLMVNGAFNINSTSVEAWKIFLSSLKGKPVAYLDKTTSVNGTVKTDQATPQGTPVSPFTVPNGKPAAAPGAPSDADQWTSARDLSDSEISQLATAIVKQVKLRGPFLSLSEFVNRRLDASNSELSTKGALQAALDDPDVSINASFRKPSRQFSDAEQASVAAAFPEAMKGPIAYGSAAYVDQADILRNFGEQLTPRGDTFVIRTYGDSLDAQGNVQARAWCEAVIQRVPEYVDPTDEAHLKQVDLKSSANKNFGRKFQIVSYRWLNSKEISKDA